MLEADHHADQSLECVVLQFASAQVAASEHVPLGPGPVEFDPEPKHDGEILRREVALGQAQVGMFREGRARNDRAIPFAR